MTNSSAATGGESVETEAKTVVKQRTKDKTEGLKTLKRVFWGSEHRHPLVDKVQPVFVLCNHNLKQRSCPDLMLLHDRTSQVDYKSPRCYVSTRISLCREESPVSFLPTSNIIQRAPPRLELMISFSASY